MNNTRITVRCQDGQVRHSGAFTTMAEASNWAWWGHICAAHHDFEQTTEREVEAGNVHVGDVIVLPGDLEGTITGLEWLHADVMNITTDLGSLLGVRFSAKITVLS